MQITVNWPTCGPFSRSSLTLFQLETFSQHRTDASACDDGGDNEERLLKAFDGPPFWKRLPTLSAQCGDDRRTRRCAVVQQVDNRIDVEVGVQ